MRLNTAKHDDVVDPIYSVLNLDRPTESSPFDAVSPPFIAMERGPGGHAPYGTFSGTATEYFEKFGPEKFDGLLADYTTHMGDVENIKLPDSAEFYEDEQKFKNRLNELTVR